MSKHYLLNVAFQWNGGVTPEEQAALDYAVNGAGPAPQAWPDHPAFQGGGPGAPIPRAYGGFADGEFVCVHWRGAAPAGRSGVTLLLPGIKDIQGWYDALKFVDWLCSIGQSQGLVGYIVEEDDPSAATLLYSFDGLLYLREEKKAGDVVSFRTGQARA